MIEKNTGKCKKTHHFHTKSILSIIDITEKKISIQFILFHTHKKKKERKKIYWHRQGSSHHQMIDDDWIDQQESLLHFFSTILLLSSFFSKTNITNPIKFIGYNFIIGFFLQSSMICWNFFANFQNKRRLNFKILYFDHSFWHFNTIFE